MRSDWNQTLPSWCLNRRLQQNITEPPLLFYQLWNTARYSLDGFIDYIRNVGTCQQCHHATCFCVRVGSLLPVLLGHTKRLQCIRFCNPQHIHTKHDQMSNNHCASSQPVPCTSEEACIQCYHENNKMHATIWPLFFNLLGCDTVVCVILKLPLWLFCKWIGLFVHISARDVVFLLVIFLGFAEFIGMCSHSEII
jgi:hypothetical protein